MLNFLVPVYLYLGWLLCCSFSLVDHLQMYIWDTYLGQIPPERHQSTVSLISVFLPIFCHLVWRVLNHRCTVHITFLVYLDILLLAPRVYPCSSYSSLRLLSGPRARQNMSPWNSKGCFPGRSCIVYSLLVFRSFLSSAAISMWYSRAPLLSQSIWLFRGWFCTRVCILSSLNMWRSQKILKVSHSVYLAASSFSYSLCSTRLWVTSLAEGVVVPLMKCSYYQYTGTHFANLGRMTGWVNLLVY